MLAPPSLTEPIPQTVCILSPVKVRESTFVSLGDLHTRQIRLVAATSQSGQEGEDPVYVAQLSLHIAECDEVIQLPLLALKEDSTLAYSYDLYIDLRPNSVLSKQVMPFLSFRGDKEAMQCDMLVFELIAAAIVPDMAQIHEEHRSSRKQPQITPIACSSETSLLTVPSMDSESIVKDNDASSFDGLDDEKRHRRSSFGSLFGGSRSQGNRMVRKVSKKMQRLSDKTHRRALSNPQLRYSTGGIDFSLFDKPTSDD